jgi:hypothetical protein
MPECRRISRALCKEFAADLAKKGQHAPALQEVLMLS